MVPYVPDTLPMLPPARSCLNHFDAFTPFHWITVGACLALIALWCALARRLLALDRAEGSARERALRHAIAYACLAFQGFATVWRLLPAHFTLDESIPLHLCRLVGFIAPIALLTLGRRWRALTFFWGLGLSTQGYLTPMWHEGLASVAFWLYWVGHTMIIGAAAYDLAVLGYRPSARDLRFAALLGVAVTLAISLVNIPLGTNYCYLGRADYAGASVVDLLGRWPVRPIVIIAGGVFIFVLLYLVSTLLPRPGARPSAPHPEPASARCP